MTLARPFMPHIVDFRRVTDAASLAGHLSCAAETIVAAIGGGPAVYRELRIPKRNARRNPSYRLVHEVIRSDVADALKAFQRRFYDFARDVDRRFPSEHAHGYLPGRSILTNARPHVGATRLLRADIRNFFPSITAPQVERILRSLGVGSQGCELMAALLTIDGSLPLGLPSSPLLANLACVTLDEKLASLASKHGCRYTRYADDLTFSSNGALPSKFELTSTLLQEGFELAEDKLRIKKRGQSFYVTGLSVSENDRPRASAQLKKRLRQELFFIEKYGLLPHVDARGYPALEIGINKIDGRIRYLRAVDSKVGDAFLVRWQAVLAKEATSPTYLSRPTTSRRNVVWLVDESEVASPKGPLFMVCLVAVEDATRVEAGLDAELSELRSDAFYAGSTKKLEKKGLHFVDLPEDVRARIAERLQRLPFRAYVTWDNVDSAETYPARYERLLKVLLQPRLTASDGHEVRLLIERNDSLREQDLREMIGQAHAELGRSSARRPSRLDMEMVGKDATTLIALPDLAMGYLAAYLGSKQPPARPSAQVRFERLRDKFRTIRPFGQKRPFGRRYPVTEWEPPAG